MGKVIVGIIVVVLLFVALFLLGIIGRGVDTASKVADKTVFNEDKIVYSYEEFHRKYEAYQQYKSQQEAAEGKLKELEAKGVKSGQRYDNLAMEADGARQMRNRIASEYNAMSKIAYQGIWKDKGLPEKLE
ncbi:hypothetical protein IPM19_04975 [bacterium]|nr:MAG: hypothetical protein IPM19_04975 [bacterium]